MPHLSPVTPGDPVRGMKMSHLQYPRRRSWVSSSVLQLLTKRSCPAHHCFTLSSGCPSFLICSWAAPSLHPQGLSLALVHTQQQSLPIASELAKAGDLQKTSNGIKCRTISKCGQKPVRKWGQCLCLAVCICLIYDGGAGGSGGQAKSCYMVVEPPEIPHIASCTGLEMVHWLEGEAWAGKDRKAAQHGLSSQHGQPWAVAGQCIWSLAFPSFSSLLLTKHAQVYV